MGIFNLLIQASKSLLERKWNLYCYKQMLMIKLNLNKSKNILIVSKLQCGNEANSSSNNRVNAHVSILIEMLS